MIAVAVLAGAWAPASVAGQTTTTAPSGAQETGSSSGQPMPAVGGASFSQAPVLEPGRYEDTLLAEETVYYAVRLGPGQSATLEATIDTTPSTAGPDDLSQIGGSQAFADVWSPLRQPFNDNRGFGEDAGGAVTLRAQTPEVLPREQAAEVGTQYAYAGPGTYYLTIFTTVGGRDVENVVELPLELELTVDGPPAPDQRGIGPRAEGDPLGLPGGEPPSERREPAAEGGSGAGSSSGDGDEGGSVPPQALAGSLVGGLVLGATFGVVASRRRRRG
jgi:Ca-activated chloride channel family protein